MVFNVRLDPTRPFSRIYGAGDDPTFPVGTWAEQGGVFFREDGSCVDDPADPPPPAKMKVPPRDTADVLVETPDAIWQRFRAQIFETPAEGPNGEVA